MDFVKMLKLFLVEEKGHTKEEAERLTKAYPDIVMQGIMAWNLNATAMALEMKDETQTT